MVWTQGISMLFGIPLQMGAGEVFALIFGVPAIGLVAIPFAMIWTHHRRKMEELKVQRAYLHSQDIQAQFDAIRAEIRDLRDTSMQYDLSFDAAMHRVENRLEHLERKSIAQNTNYASETPQQNPLYGGRG